MAFNLDFLKDVGGSGLNIFGAGKPKYLDRMSKLGLLDETAITEAEDKSLYKGLLGTALSYLAQPKNQNYGSAFPYLGKALMTGVEQAEDPYKTLSKEAMMNQQLGEYEKKLNAETALKDIYKTVGGETMTTKGIVNTKPIMQTMPDGAVVPMPNYGEVQTDTFTTPTQNVVDLEKLKELKFKNPTAYNEYLKMAQAEANISKTSAEAGKLLSPDVDYSTLGKEYRDLKRGGDTRFKNITEYALFKEGQAKQQFDINLNKDKALLDVDIAVLDRLSTAADSAGNVSRLTSVIDTLIPEDITTGGIVQIGANIQDYLGLNTPTANVNQLIQAIATQGAMTVRTPGSGSTSDLEFNSYKQAFPTLATTRNGRKLMVEVAKANQMRMNKLLNKAKKMVKETGGIDNEALAEYDNELGLAVNDSIRKQIEEQLAESGKSLNPITSGEFDDADKIVGR